MKGKEKQNEGTKGREKEQKVEKRVKVRKEGCR